MNEGNLIRGRTLGELGTSEDYFVAVAGRRIPGALDDRIVGRCLDIGSTAFETLWDQGGNYTYLTADTQLFASSTSASDTSVILLVQGLDADHKEVGRIVELNGQTQVPLAGLMFRVHAAIVGNATTPLGDVYIAEADTLTAGVPDTPSKIKTKVELSPADVGEFASWNISHNGFFTVPAGKNMHVLALFPSTPKNCDIQLDFRARVPGGAWLSINTIWSYQSPTLFPFAQAPRITEKSDVEMRVIAGSDGSSYEANLQFILVDE